MQQWTAATGPTRSAEGLSPWQRRGLFVLFAVTVLFGCLVERRSAFLTRPMTDLQVYLRASWAVRTGADLYGITDDNDWHYHYPPLLAIVMTPLADAPAGAERSGLLPFAATVGIWYVFSVLCLAWGVHVLASALEATSAVSWLRDSPLGGRRWWALRIVPVLVCVTSIGGTLSRGQVNLLLLALLCGMIAAAIRGRHGLAGFWLAGAICLKLIPLFLFVYPVWRRDVRWLAGCALGLILGMVVIPTAVFGPAQTVAYYQEWTEVLIRPGLGQTEEQSRAKELIEVTATDSQSFLATMHNTAHLNRLTRPNHCSPLVRRAHWLIGGLLTLLTLLAAGSKRALDGPAQTMALGALIVLMILISPVCHLHYFCLALPLVMGLLAAGWERGETLGQVRGLALLVALHFLGTTLPRLPAFWITRDIGLAMYATLLLWVAGAVLLSQRHAY